MASDPEYREFLCQALEAERGIKLSTDDPQRLIQKLHAIRRGLKDETFDVLVIAVSRTNPSGEVWIVKQPKPKSPGGTNAEEE